MVKIFQFPRAVDAVASFLSPDDRLTFSCVHKNLPPIHVPVERFSFSKEYVVQVSENGKINKVPSRVCARVFTPKYLEVSSVADLKYVTDTVDHGVSVKVDHGASASWVVENLDLLQRINHTLDLSDCGLCEVSQLAHVQHTLDLSNNNILDVGPLAGVKKRLVLKNNYIVDVAPLVGVKRDLDLRDNYILDARRIRNIPGLLVEGNFIHGLPRQKLAFLENDYALQVVSEIQQEVQNPFLVQVLSQWLGVIPQLAQLAKKKNRNSALYDTRLLGQMGTFC